MSAYDQEPDEQYNSYWDANEDTIHADCGCWESESHCHWVGGKLMCAKHADEAEAKIPEPIWEGQ